MYLIRFSALLVAWVVSYLLTSIVAAQNPTTSQRYFPGRWGDWETRTAEQVGMDGEKLKQAVEFAKKSENRDSKNLANVIATSFANEPHNQIVGPTKNRGAANGLIIKNGFIVAQWGDTERVDMTFSVTKSYLSTVAAVAFDSKVIKNVDDPVGKYVRDGKFASDHNSKITWRHLLDQTSDWSGTLWDKPDWADRPVGRDRKKWIDRKMNEPGTVMKYNDVRVNLLAYCLLQTLRKPLPVVLREKIMDPIGASPSWRWHGYKNSWVVLDGQKIQSVSGGGHWGGGLFICSRDHARLGYLFLNNGKWKGKQLVSAEWIKAATTPSKARSDYGFMWWLNTDQKRIRKAPASSFFGAGFGGNYIYVDRENDLVIVLRWTPNLPGVVERVIDSIKK